MDLLKPTLPSYRPISSSKTVKGFSSMNLTLFFVWLSHCFLQQVHSQPPSFGPAYRCSFPLLLQSCLLHWSLLSEHFYWPPHFAHTLFRLHLCLLALPLQLLFSRLGVICLKLLGPLWVLSQCKVHSRCSRNLWLLINWRFNFLLGNRLEVSLEWYITNGTNFFQWGMVSISPALGLVRCFDP